MANSKRALFEQIQQHGFAVAELALFLDTHPNDAEALKDHNALATKLSQLTSLYNKNYGMMTIDQVSRGATWEWVEGLWPWEKNFEED